MQDRNNNDTLANQNPPQNPSGSEIINEKPFLPEKKTSSLKIILAVIFLLLLGIALAAFFYWNQLSKLTAKPIPTSTTVQSKNPVTSMSQIYHGNGFELIYPNTWNAKYDALIFREYDGDKLTRNSSIKVFYPKTDFSTTQKLFSLTGSQGEVLP